MKNIFFMKRIYFTAMIILSVFSLNCKGSLFNDAINSPEFPALNAECRLSNLVISAGILTPAFNENIESYEAEVGNLTDSITITPTVKDDKSSITLNEYPINAENPSQSLTLSTGLNAVEIIVTAENAVTTKTYTISITRLSTLSNNANLSNLILSDGSLVPTFNPDITIYTAEVTYSITSVTVTPSVSGVNASAKVNEETVISGSPSSAISLDVGANIVAVIVTAENALITKTYTVTVSRMESQGAISPPANLQASNGTYDNKISLSWNAVISAESYSVYRSDEQNGTYDLLDSTTMTVYDDLDTEDTILYYYKVKAYSTALGYSDFSDSAAGSRKQGYVFVRAWGNTGSGDGQFSSPYNVAVDSSGYIYVLDTYNHRVQKFDAYGNLQTKWGGITLSSEDGKFYYPKGIAVNGNNVFVGDGGGHVQKFNLTGTYIDSFMVGGTMPDVSDIDLDNSGNIYIAVNMFTDPYVYKYNSLFALQTFWGGSGEQNGQFSGEIHLAVDNVNSRIIVSDNGHDKIQYFTMNGTYGGSWGSSGTGNGQFNSPQGVAVDSEGDVFVADDDYDNRSVQKFTFSGGLYNYICSWTHTNSYPWTSIAADDSTDIIILVTNDGSGNNGSIVKIYERR